VVVMEGEGEDMVEAVVEGGMEVEVAARTILAPLTEVEVVVSHDLAVLIIHVTALIVAHRPERHHVISLLSHMRGDVITGVNVGCCLELIEIKRTETFCCL